MIVEKMDKCTVNNEIVSFRHDVRQAKVHTINKLLRESKKLKSRKGTDQQKEKSLRKAKRFSEEVLLIKKLKEDDVSKFALSNMRNLAELLADVSVPLEKRVLARLAGHKSLSTRVDNFRSRFPTWEHILPPLLAEIGSRSRKKGSKKPKKKLAKPVTSNVAQIRENVIKDKQSETAELFQEQNSENEVDEDMIEQVNRDIEEDNENNNLLSRLVVKRKKVNAVNKTQIKKCVIKKNTNRQKVISDGEEGNETTNLPSRLVIKRKKVNAVNKIQLKKCVTKNIKNSKKLTSDGEEDNETSNLPSRLVIKQKKVNAVNKIQIKKCVTKKIKNSKKVTSDDEEDNETSILPSRLMMKRKRVNAVSKTQIKKCVIKKNKTSQKVTSVNKTETKKGLVKNNKDDQSHRLSCTENTARKRVNTIAEVRRFAEIDVQDNFSDIEPKSVVDSENDLSCSQNKIRNRENIISKVERFAEVNFKDKFSDTQPKSVIDSETDLGKAVDSFFVTEDGQSEYLSSVVTGISSTERNIDTHRSFSGKSRLAEHFRGDRGDDNSSKINKTFREDNQGEESKNSYKIFGEATKRKFNSDDLNFKSFQHKPKSGLQGINRKERRRKEFQQQNNKGNTFGTQSQSKGAEGPIHPSWEAKKRLQEQNMATFQGKKIIFDD